MTPKDILDLNGDSSSSPLLDTLRRLDDCFTAEGISYAVVGGLAVVRNGATRTTVDIDILFPGNEWGMEIPMPHPADIGERDIGLGAVFASPAALLEIKCAVYRKKLREDGMEIAAKDLYDVTERLKARGDALTEEDLRLMNPVIASHLRAIRKKVLGR